mmetsp:Transcript_29843/g.44050  ORF Transcript_29843/g.44050 Transcript_29843/m.44050 type:complete len:207 (+) Transcript_29843:640-1260(+)
MRLCSLQNAQHKLLLVRGQCSAMIAVCCSQCCCQRNNDIRTLLVRDTFQLSDQLLKVGRFAKFKSFVGFDGQLFENKRRGDWCSCRARTQRGMSIRSSSLLDVVGDLRQMVLRQLMSINEPLGRNKRVLACIVPNLQLRHASALCINFDRKDKVILFPVDHSTVASIANNFADLDPSLRGGTPLSSNRFAVFLKDLHLSFRLSLLK